jgi:hypothetical protein
MHLKVLEKQEQAKPQSNRLKGLRSEKEEWNRD